MAESTPRDENRVKVIFGALNTDGTTVTPVQANPSTHFIRTDDNTTGTDHGPTNDIRDQDFETGLMAVSSADGVTPVVLYVNASGQLLIDSA